MRVFRKVTTESTSSFAERFAQLVFGHLGHRLIERLHRSIVVVGSGLLDVAQAGNLEDHLVGILLGESEAALVGAFGPRLHQAQLLEHAAAQVHAVVAGLAAGIEELVQTRLFAVGESRLVAGQELVPAGRRDQLALESADGLARRCRTSRILLAGEGLLERRHVLGHGFQHAHHMRRASGMAISTGLTIGPLACSSTVAARPSQNCTKWPAAL